LQVQDDKSGYLVTTVEECAQRIGQLLSDPELRNRMGSFGREEVRDRFLITRYLHDYVRMFRQLSGSPGRV
jgi:trehalose synthase